VSRFKSDPELRELYRIWQETGNASVLPGRPSRVIRINDRDKELTALETARYTQLVGRLTRDVSRRIMESPTYQAAPDERKAEVFSQITAGAAQTAKVVLFGQQPRELNRFARAMIGLARADGEARN
jgi:hypothetical protein